MINEVYNIDNMKYMKTIEDNYFELAIVDPPYGVKITKDDMSNRKLKNKKKLKKWDNKIPNKKYFKELKRISINQIIWGGNYFLDILGKTESPIIWDKMNPMIGKRNDFEFAWSSIKKTNRIFKYAWIGYARIWVEKDNPIHPTQKPVALYKWLLSNYAKPGDKILDTHEGSGSHRIACYELGFDHFGCENDIDYWNDQELRFNEFKKKFHNEFYIPKNEMSLFN